MDPSKCTKEELIRKLEQLEIENATLKAEMNSPIIPNNAFSLEEYKRYGRQMIVPEFGFDAQIKLKNSKILVIGAGGLGCPALMYLGGAGIGKIGIVDDDTVDISNLHRQVMHTTDKVGEFKCNSAKQYINKLNPFVEVEVYPFRLSNENAFDIFEGYDLVLDCTDTPLTRYLISDVAVLSRIPVVSGSGLKTEGQLSILNFDNCGPCYRCFYPKAPPPSAVTSCSDGGVIGPAIGLMGIMMALETIKVLSGTYKSEEFKPFLTIYSGYPQQTLRTFKMRGRKSGCASCSENATITKELIINGTINYAEFCGSINDNVLNQAERVTVAEYKSILDNNEKHTLLDVRPKEQYNICRLSNAVHLPWDQLSKIQLDENIKGQLQEPIFVVCRYGNDSQLATRLIKDKFQLQNTKDIVGGLFKWSENVDPNFPQY